MKKFMFLGLAFALLLTLSAGAVAAAPLGAPGDGDGVRDFAAQGLGEGRGPAYGWVDEAGNGVNDRFVDEDGDGVCDLAGQMQGAAYGRNGQAGQGAQAGMGRQAGAAGEQRGKGAGMMARFVDADDNGICDNLEQE